VTATAQNWLNDLYSDHSVRLGGAARMGNARQAASLTAYLAGGFPDARSLPKQEIVRATQAALEAEGEWALQYGANAGLPSLVEQLRVKLERDQGIDAKPENILITYGGSQAVALAASLYIDPGDVVLSEVPVWTGAVRHYLGMGADVREIDVHAEGTDVEQLERVLNQLRREGKQAKLLYVIPNFQNPTGVTTTLERRRRIVELAQEHNVAIVEDDAYFDLRFSGEQLSTLYTLDDSGRVMYTGTFSKIMAAGMRLGWAVGSEDVINRMLALKIEGGTSPFGSYVAAEFASSGALQAHIQNLRGIYKARCDAMLTALETYMPDGAEWTHPQGGFFIWVTFPDGVDATKLTADGAAQGAVVNPGTAFYYHGRGRDQIRLSYSFPTEAQINAGVKILGDLAKQQLVG
jgi:2-aminoadipate transaminase